MQNTTKFGEYSITEMKNILLLSFALTLSLIPFGFRNKEITGNKCSLTISWEFKNVEEGYDHDNKCKVWIDGEPAGESSVKKETKPNTLKIKTTQGSHQVKIVNYSLYENSWEEHTLENDYGIDCVFEEWVDLRKKTKINLVFDIDEGVSNSIE